MSFPSSRSTNRHRTAEAIQAARRKRLDSLAELHQTESAEGTRGQGGRALARMLAETNSQGCRWPVGEPERPGFYFCGSPKDPADSYCAVHRAKSLTRDPWCVDDEGAVVRRGKP